MQDVLDLSVRGTAAADADRHPARDDGAVIPRPPRSTTRGALSYRELMALVGRTAARLHDAGVRRGDRVGVRVPSGSKELYVAILGILAAGAAYVPGRRRRSRRARATGVRRGRRAGRHHATAACSSAPCRARRATPDPRRDACSSGDAPHPSTRAIVTVPPPTVDDDAWIIFTSGSTGVPKGVAVTPSLGGRVRRRRGAPVPAVRPARPGDRVLAGLSVAFDASCEEMWLAWRHGACLVPAPRALVRSGEDLAPWLVRQAITVVSTVPTLAAMWPQRLRSRTCGC